MANTREHNVKRACVNVGIGRELYTAPFIWLRSGDDCKIEDDSGRKKCNDRFEVDEIDYNAHREISRLRIVNSKTHNVVFDWQEKPEDKKRESMAVTCERCGKVLTGAVLSDGTTMTAGQLIAKSKIECGGVYCLECQGAILEAKAKTQPKVQPKAQSKAGQMATPEQVEYIRTYASDADYEAIMLKYGAELERLTEKMAEKVIAQINANNAKAG